MPGFFFKITLYIQIRTSKKDIQYMDCLKISNLFWNRKDNSVQLFKPVLEGIIEKILRQCTHNVFICNVVTMLTFVFLLKHYIVKQHARQCTHKNDWLMLSFPCPCTHNRKWIPDVRNVTLYYVNTCSSKHCTTSNIVLQKYPLNITENNVKIKAFVYIMIKNCKWHKKS